MAKGKKTGGRNFKPGEGGRKPGATNLKTRIRKLNEEKRCQLEQRREMDKSRFEASPEILEALIDKAKDGNRLVIKTIDSLVDRQLDCTGDEAAIVADLIRGLKQKVDFHNYWELYDAWLALKLEYMDIPEIIKEIDKQIKPFIVYAAKNYEREKEEEQERNIGLGVIDLVLNRISSDPDVRERLKEFLPQIITDIEKKYGIQAESYLNEEYN